MFLHLLVASDTVFPRCMRIKFSSPIGTPAMTTRGLVDSDFEIVAEHLHSAVRIALRLQLTSGPKLKSFASLLDSDAEVALLRERVVSFASGFPMPGDVADS